MLLLHSVCLWLPVKRRTLLKTFYESQLQQLRVYISPLEDPSSSLRTQTRQLTTTCNVNFTRSNTLFWPLQVPMLIWTNPHSNPHTHIIKNNNNNNKTAKTQKPTPSLVGQVPYYLCPLCHKQAENIHICLHAHKHIPAYIHVLTHAYYTHVHAHRCLLPAP